MNRKKYVRKCRILYEQNLHPDFAVDELMFSFFKLSDCFVVLEDLLKPC